jgi:nitroimidazol reductase NimA-like FMN-containing flavoprotein (pyridoxamine 5'-phosphate oxidase superfamily)
METRDSSPPTATPLPDRRRPLIRSLSQHECIEVLARNYVGRIGFVWQARVEIQPLNYVYEAGWIYGRTSEGLKVSTLAHHQWIAFEVDEVRDTFEWTSVLIHGSFHRLDADSPLYNAADEAHAVRLLRRIIPGAFTAEDPTPSRTVTFRIAVGETTGRMAIPI